MKYGLYVDFIENNPTYVGIGTKYRINKIERNQKHTNFSKKYKINRKVLFFTDDYKWLQIQEILAIKYFNTFYENNSKYGCNLTPGGEGISNVCKEVRLKISNSHKGKKLKTSTKIKLSKHFTGRTHSQDSKDKVSKNMGGKYFKIFKDGKLLGTYINQLQCCRDYNLTRNGLRRCLKGEQYQHNGYRFEYI